MIVRPGSSVRAWVLVTATVAASAVFASAARAECEDIRWELRNIWSLGGGAMTLVSVAVCHDHVSPTTTDKQHP